MSEFDDLFNRFFGGKRNQKKNKKEEISDFDEAKNDNIKKLIEMLDSMEEVTNSETAKQIDDNLGEPDRVEYYEEKGMFFEKKVWRVFGGEMVKVIISDEPFEVKKNESTLTLKEQLDEAIKNEDYEIAANIRDAIKKEEKKQKKLQKNLTK